MPHNIGGVGGQQKEKGSGTHCMFCGIFQSSVSVGAPDEFQVASSSSREHCCALSQQLCS